MKFTDVHVHLEDERFDDDREETIKRAFGAGAEFLINGGSSVKSSRKGVEIAGQYDNIYCCVGVHPHDADKTQPDSLEIIAELAANKKVIAIGEIGLDYYYDYSDREVQKEWFRKFMSLAADLNLPVVIHDRDAHADCLETVKIYAGKVKGIYHCYSGSVEYAREIMKLGYAMSFGGITTFSNAKTCVEVVKSLPAEMILTETDAPYLAPSPFRGRRNEPSYVPHIISKIAEIRNVSPEIIAETTIENAKRIFNIPSTG